MLDYSFPAAVRLVLAYEKGNTPRVRVDLVIHLRPAVGPTMNVQIEKRRHKRDEAALEVRCESFGLDEIFVSRDVSAGGLFLKTPDPLVAGSTVELTFRVSPEAPDIACSGRVVYSLPGVGMGIQFLDVTGAIETSLKREWHTVN